MIYLFLKIFYQRSIISYRAYKFFLKIFLFKIWKLVLEFLKYFYSSSGKVKSKKQRKGYIRRVLHVISFDWSSEFLNIKNYLLK